jgi:NAD-dependent SIR2 family protein deacetylase
MAQYKDAVAIVGPEAISSLNLNRPTIEELQENFVRKIYKRQPEKFWQFYRERMFIDPTLEMSETYQNIKALVDLGLIGTIISQNTDGMFTHRSIPSIELHGNTLNCSCSHSSHPKIYTPYPAIIPFSDIPYCELCGSMLKPEAIFLNDRYDDDKYHLAKEAVCSAHTLIAIGVDYTETAILDLISKFDIIRESNLMGDTRMLVAMYENKSDSLDLNEDLGFFEFQVKDTCDASTTRFLQAFQS